MMMTVSLQETYFLNPAPPESQALQALRIRCWRGTLSRNSDIGLQKDFEVHDFFWACHTNSSGFCMINARCSANRHLYLGSKSKGLTAFQRVRRVPEVF